jgi:phosphotransacetylase
MYSEKVLLRKMKNALNYAAILVKIGDADCLASGVVNSTGDVILAAQQFIGLKEGIFGKE